MSICHGALIDVQYYLAVVGTSVEDLLSVAHEVVQGGKHLLQKVDSVDLKDLVRLFKNRPHTRIDRLEVEDEAINQVESAIQEIDDAMVERDLDERDENLLNLS